MSGPGASGSSTFLSPGCPALVSTNFILGQRSQLSQSAKHYSQLPGVTVHGWAALRGFLRLELCSLSDMPLGIAVPLFLVGGLPEGRNK